MKVQALVQGEPGPLELWTLRAAADAGCGLAVVRTPAERGRWTARALAACLERGERALLEELADAARLRAWLRDLPRGDGSPPDVVLLVSGPPPAALGPARPAVLEVRHGMPPFADGAWSIPRALVEGRAECVGASIRLLGASGQRAVLWRGAPQLAPGDTGPDLLFRAHVQAGAALTGLLRALAAGAAPAPVRLEAPAAPSRGEPRLAERLRYLRLGRGLAAEVLLERGIA